MTTIRFTRSPASITLGEALGLGARYWAASWERWVLAVVAVGLASGLSRQLLGASLVDQQAVIEAIRTGATIDPATVPRLLAGPLAVGIVTLVADWFLYANAITGLRGEELGLPRILAAGLRVLLAALVVAPAAALLATTLTLLGAIGVLGILALIPVVVYLALRLQFWTYGLFDGRGIVDALRTSWELTRGAVLRVLGWGLALAGLSLLVSGVGLVASFALQALPALPAAIVSALSTTFQAFSVIVIAILYESQRLRSIEGLPAPYGWGPVASVPGGWGEPRTVPPANHEPVAPDPDPPADPPGPPSPPPPPGGPTA